VAGPSRGHGFDIFEYWTVAPPERSPRLEYWLNRVEYGWRRNRRIRAMGASESARFFGVYMWEWLNVLWPAMVRRGQR